MCLKELFTKTVYVQEPGDFKTEEELTKWCHANWNFKIKSDNPSRKDCDDYARELRRRAYADGHHMSLALLENGRIYYHQPIKKGDHMGNLALTEEPEPAAYYIDAQFKVIEKLTNLD
jgi:hypothetical protein